MTFSHSISSRECTRDFSSPSGQDIDCKDSVGFSGGTTVSPCDEEEIYREIVANDDRSMLSGQDILSRDGTHIILGCSELYDDLPPGNTWYEEAIAEFCEDKMSNDGSLTFATDDVKSLITYYMCVRQSDDGSLTFMTSEDTKTFWAMTDGVPDNTDWKQKRFTQVTAYSTLKVIAWAALKLRMKQANKRAFAQVTDVCGTDDDDRKIQGTPYSQPKKARRAVAKAVHGTDDDYNMKMQNLKMIRSCQKIDDFIEMYDGRLVHDCLQRIKSASCGKDPEEWAKEWAQQLLMNDEAAASLDRDRELCLELLFTLCNCWRGWKGIAPTVTKEQIVDNFQSRRIVGILGECLVMDRAKTLYFMPAIGKAERGIHWYAEQQVEAFSEERKVVMTSRGEPSMNKRYLWLRDMKELGLGVYYRDLCEWMKPEMVPSRPEPDVAR